MRKFYVILILLVLTCVAAHAQSRVNSAFIGNMVKIPAPQSSEEETPPRFGFITAVRESTKSVFFVMIYPKRGKVLTGTFPVFYYPEGNEKKAKTAAARYMETVGPIGIGENTVALYELNASPQTTRRYYSAIDATEKGYYLLTDLQRDSRELFVPYVNQTLAQKPGVRTERNKPIPFLIANQKDIGGSGLPLVDENGTLKGLTGTFEKKHLNFVVLDIVTIRDVLYRVGGADQCLYFNLIQKGETQTPCEQKAAAAAANKAAAKADSIRIRNATSRERKVIRADNDYPFIFALTGALTANSFGVTAPEVSSSYGGFSYFAGASLFIRPDNGWLGLSARPRYSSFMIGPGDNYRIEANPSFSWTKARFTSVDMPLMLDIRFRETNGGGNTFLGLGYSLGLQKISSFDFTDGTQWRKQAIVGNPELVKKYIGEVGFEKGNVRLSLFASVQTSPYLRRDYEMIINGVSTKPFQDIKKTNYSIGAELAFRLWGRWQNGKIY